MRLRRTIIYEAKMDSESTHNKIADVRVGTVARHVAKFEQLCVRPKWCYLLPKRSAGSEAERVGSPDFVCAELRSGPTSEMQKNDAATVDSEKRVETVGA